MDINFIIFFLFLLLIVEYISYTEDGMTLIIMGFFIAAIFANTQSASPLFFSNSDYLGWGKLFNFFWLVFIFICFVKSYVLAKSKGLFGGIK